MSGVSSGVFRDVKQIRDLKQIVLVKFVTLYKFFLMETRLSKVKLTTIGFIAGKTISISAVLWAY